MWRSGLNGCEGGGRAGLLGCTYLPSGENLMSRTGFLKLKWCSTVERAKFAIKARPSVERRLSGLAWAELGTDQAR